MDTDTPLHIPQIILTGDSSNANTELIEQPIISYTHYKKLCLINNNKLKKTKNYKCPEK